MRSEEWWWRLRRDPSTQVASVLAFVISHTTFLAAQDDETGRCPKADFSLLPEEGARGWSGRCPKAETSGFLVSQT